MSSPPVPLDTATGELAGRSVAVLGHGPDGHQTLALLTFGTVRRGRVLTRIFDTATRTPMPEPVTVVPEAATRLDALVLAHAHVSATSAGFVDRVAWPQSWPTIVLAHPRLAAVTGPALALTLLILTWLLAPQALAAIIPVYVMALVVLARHRRLPASGEAFVIESGERVRPSIVAARVPGLDAAASGPTPADRVHLVKAEYGRLLTDVCYRIENSALFDAAVPETSRFQVALLTWDSLAPTSPDAERAATEIETSFAAARAHAERLGWDHLPNTAREPARRARLAATTALGDGPEGERAAARRRVADILGSLALYYLPPIDSDAPQLIGRRKAIEPAP